MSRRRQRRPAGKRGHGRARPKKKARAAPRTGTPVATNTTGERAWWRPTISRGPMLVALLVMVLTLTLSFLWSEDVWWYLASGEEVLDRGGFPDHEIFLFTSDQDTAWPQHSWLSTVIVAALGRTLGLAGVVVGGALVAALIFALIYLRFPVDRYGLVNGGLAMLVAMAVTDRLSLRTELATWLLLVVFVLVAERRRPFTPALLAGLALGQWLWSNLHAGYLLGIFVMLAYSVGGWLQPKWRAWRAATPQSNAPAHGPALWLAPALFLVSLATPQIASRWQMLTAVSDIFGQRLAGNSLGVSMVELQPTFGAAADPRYGRLFLLCLLVSLWGLARNRHSPRLLSRLLLIGGLGVLAYTGIRYVTGLALVTALVTTANLHETAAQRHPRAPRLHLMSAAVLVLVLLSAAIGLERLSRDLEVGQSRDHFFTASTLATCPGAADYIRQQALPGPIFNDLILGGYLTHALYPERQLYIDNRVLRGALVGEYVAASQSLPAWQSLMERYDFRTVVLTNVATPSPMPLRSALARDPAWQLVYFDPLASVLVRTDADADAPPAQRAIAGGDPDGVPFMSPRRPFAAVTAAAARLFFTADPAEHFDHYLAVLSELGKHKIVATLVTRALGTIPDTGTNTSTDGAAAPLLLHRGIARLRLGRAARALDDIERATGGKPETPHAAYYLAFALEANGRTDPARSALDRARRRWPDDRGLAVLEQQWTTRPH